MSYYSPISIIMTQKFKHWYRLNRKEIALSALTAVCIVLFLAAFSLWTGKALRMMLFIPLLFAGKFFAAWKINARVRTGLRDTFYHRPDLQPCRYRRSCNMCRPIPRTGADLHCHPPRDNVLHTGDNKLESLDAFCSGTGAPALICPIVTICPIVIICPAVAEPYCPQKCRS